ncbi:MAG: hypothetical protein D6744_03945 [Planctomycetota bacterium]|nr:MAG: hypothetical protein D6744_03945 [Planctomycetota bacterium]
MLYPNVYVWFVFVAALDVMCTYVILHPVLFPAPLPPAATPESPDLDAHLLSAAEPRGQEVNALAAWVIEHGGMPGTVGYKFSLVLLIVLICEIVGRRRYRLGRRLAEWSVAITTIPVIVAIVQIARDVLRH